MQPAADCTNLARSGGIVLRDFLAQVSLFGALSRSILLFNVARERSRKIRQRPHRSRAEYCASRPERGRA